MAKLRHIAITVPDPEKAAGAKHWMGAPTGGTGFYEVKYHDPDGIAFDITANGWAGAKS